MRSPKKFIFSLSVLFFCHSSLFSEDWNVDQSGNWSVDTNWHPQSVPNGATAIAQFPNILTQGRTVTVDGAFQVSTLNFTSFNPYNLSSGTLNMSAPSSINIDMFNGSHSIGTTLNLLGGLTITNNIASNFTISGPITGGGSITSANGTVILSGPNTYTGMTSVTGGDLQGTTTSIQGNVANAATLTFNQTTMGSYGGMISGVGNVVIAGSGVVTFTANNTMCTGEAQLNAGTLQVSAVDQLPIGTLRFNGGTLQTTASFTDSRASIVLDGNGTINTNSSTTLTLSGTIISGMGALIKAGDGTLDLGASAHTYMGGTQISGGTLQINQTLSLDVGQVTFNSGTLNNTETFTIANPFNLTGGTNFSTDPATTLTLSGAVSGDGSLTKVGAGTLSMGGPPNSGSYSGGTNINNGALNVSASGQLGVGLITFSSGILMSTVDVTQSNNFQLTSSNGTFSPSNATALTVGGTISGPGILIMDGLGTLDLGTLMHSYSGGTEISNGTLRINTSGQLGFGQVNFSGGILNSTADIVEKVSTLLNVTGTFDVDSGAVLQWNGPITGSGGLMKNKAGTLVLGGSNNYTGGTTITAGVLEGTTKSLQGDIVNDAFLIFNQNGDGLFNGTINGPNTGTLIKKGSGTVTLASLNSYTGETHFNGGTLSISNINQLGSGDLRFDGGTLQATIGMSVPQHIFLESGGGTFDTAGGTTTVTLIGTIMSSSLGKLIKTEAGTLDLGVMLNNYSGGTDINQGTLVMNLADNLGIGPVAFNGGTLSSTNLFAATLIQTGTISTNGTIDVQGANLTWSGQIGGAGELIKTGPGTLVLLGSNNYSGGTTISVGTLEGTTSGIQGNIRNDSILNFNQGFPGIYTGSILGIGSVQVNGGGTVTFSGVNTYSGGTTIAAMTTLTGTTRSLQGAIANSGTLTFNQEFNGTFDGADILGSGVLIKNGTGTTFFNGIFSFTGPTTINAGTLDLNGSFAGDVAVNAGGAFAGSNQIASLTNSGTVSIGSGIGQITATGNYTQSGTGNLIVEVDSFGFNDLLSVGGTAALGGSLNVTLLPGVYSGNETYDIITANSVSSPFSSASSSVGAPVTVSYLPVPIPNSTFVRIGIAFSGSITPVPIDVLPPNAKSVAEYLFCPGFYPDNPDLLFVMRDLVTLSPEEFAKALDQLGPAIFGALPLTDLQNNHLIADTIVANTEKYYWCGDCDRLARCPRQKSETYVWVTPIGQWQKQQGYDEQTAFNTRTYGVGAGAAHLFTPWMQFGGGVGYTYTDLGWKENSGSGHWNSVYVGPMLGFFNEELYFSLLAQGSFNYYSVDRRVITREIDRTAHNSHHSYGVLGRIDTGYKITFVTLEDDPPMSFIPTFRLSYLNIFEEGYKETGASSINLVLDRKTTAFLQPELLIKFIKEVYFSSYCGSAAFQLGWVSNIPLSSATYTSRFNVNEAFCKPNFSVQTFDRTTNQISYGLDFVLKKLEEFQLMLSYEGRAFDRLYVNGIRFQVDWKF